MMPLDEAVTRIEGSTWDDLWSAVCGVEAREFEDLPQYRKNQLRYFADLRRIGMLGLQDGAPLVKVVKERGRKIAARQGKNLRDAWIVGDALNRLEEAGLLPHKTKGPLYKAAKLSRSRVVVFKRLARHLAFEDLDRFASIAEADRYVMIEVRGEDGSGETIEVERGTLEQAADGGGEDEKMILVPASRIAKLEAANERLRRQNDSLIEKVELLLKALAAQPANVPRGTFEEPANVPRGTFEAAEDVPIAEHQPRPEKEGDRGWPFAPGPAFVPCYTRDDDAVLPKHKAFNTRPIPASDFGPVPWAETWQRLWNEGGCGVIPASLDTVCLDVDGPIGAEEHGLTDDQYSEVLAGVEQDFPGALLWAGRSRSGGAHVYLAADRSSFYPSTAERMTSAPGREWRGFVVDVIYTMMVKVYDPEVFSIVDAAPTSCVLREDLLAKCPRPGAPDPERDARVETLDQKYYRLMRRLGHKVHRGTNGISPDAALRAIAGAPLGARNDTLNKKAWFLLKNGADVSEADLVAAGVAAGLGEREARDTVRSAARRA